MAESLHLDPEKRFDGLLWDVVLEEHLLTGAGLRRICTLLRHWCAQDAREVVDCRDCTLDTCSCLGLNMDGYIRLPLGCDLCVQHVDVPGRPDNSYLGLAGELSLLAADQDSLLLLGTLPLPSAG